MKIAQKSKNRTHNINIKDFYKEIKDFQNSEVCKNGLKVSPTNLCMQSTICNVFL